MLKTSDSTSVWRAWLFSVFFGVLVIALLFPQHLFFQASPLLGSTWSLQDPAVSGWVFIPGLKVIFYEILQQGNFLWSSLKGLGMPLLGNEVQEAPIFPLTLALLWVPEAYYWNAFVILRWLLLGSGAFMLAYRVFGLQRTGALVFVLAFAFAFYHIRWVNHPYLNGIAAGVWYWYFLLIALSGSEVKSRAIKRSLPSFFGLVVSAYSVLTCGFPEASITIAAITLILGVIFLLRRLITDRHGTFADILKIAVAHLLALALAAPQVFALVEFIGLTAPGRRIGIGLHQINQDPTMFFLRQLMWDGTKSTHEDMTHIWGLVTTCLFSIGLLRGLFRRPGWIGFALFLCTALFVVKNFASIAEVAPIADSLHRFIGTLPVAEQMWWTGYAYPLVLIFFAYLAGRGSDEIICRLGTSRQLSNSRFVFLIGASIFCVIGAAALFASQVHESSLVSFVSRSLAIQQTLALFSIFAVLLITGVRFCRQAKAQILFSVLILFAILLEQRIYIDHNRVEIDVAQSLHDLRGRGKQIEAILKNHDLNRHDFRFMDFGSSGNRFGFLIGAGLGSFKNGAAAIYTHRQQKFREHVLGADWNGYFILQGVPDNQGWQRSAAGLFLHNKDYGHRVSIDELPAHLLKEGREEEYIAESVRIAKKHGADPREITKYQEDLTTAVRRSRSPQDALDQTLFWLNGVGANWDDPVFLDNISFGDSLNHLQKQRFEIPAIPDDIQQDRVRCDRLGLTPDGANDRVFALTVNPPPGKGPWFIYHINLIREMPGGIYRTSPRDFILGVSDRLDTPLLNNPAGRVNIPLEANGRQLYLFACADGSELAESQYRVEISVASERPAELRFKKLGRIGLPDYLPETGDPSEYARTVKDAALEAGGELSLIKKHAPDLLIAIDSSETPQEAFYHSMRFLKGVGVENPGEFFPRDLYLDRDALPRAYMPEYCAESSDMDDSLEQILEPDFNIHSLVVEDPSAVTRTTCQHQQGFRRVRIDRDSGKHIELEAITGPGIVVLNDYFYPGWHAIDEISGEPLVLNPANLAFRAVTLPEARNYRVTLNYRPDWLPAARISVSSALLILIVLAIYPIFRVRRERYRLRPYEEIGRDNQQQASNNKQKP
mgnify:CR=1 FL=1